MGDPTPPTPSPRYSSFPIHLTMDNSPPNTPSGIWLQNPTSSKSFSPAISSSSDTSTKSIQENFSKPDSRDNIKDSKNFANPNSSGSCLGPSTSTPSAKFVDGKPTSDSSTKINLQDSQSLHKNRKDSFTQNYSEYYHSADENSIKDAMDSSSGNQQPPPNDHSPPPASRKAKRKSFKANAANPLIESPEVRERQRKARSAARAAAKSDCSAPPSASTSIPGSNNAPQSRPDLVAEGPEEAASTAASGNPSGAPSPNIQPSGMDLIDPQLRNTFDPYPTIGTTNSALFDEDGEISMDQLLGLNDPSQDEESAALEQLAINNPSAFADLQNNASENASAALAQSGLESDSSSPLSPVPLDLDFEENIPDAFKDSPPQNSLPGRFEFEYDPFAGDGGYTPPHDGGTPPGPENAFGPPSPIEQEDAQMDDTVFDLNEQPEHMTREHFQGIPGLGYLPTPSQSTYTGQHTQAPDLLQFSFTSQPMVSEEPPYYGFLDLPKELRGGDELNYGSRQFLDSSSLTTEYHGVLPTYAENQAAYHNQPERPSFSPTNNSRDVLSTTPAGLNVGLPFGGPPGGADYTGGFLNNVSAGPNVGFSFETPPGGINYTKAFPNTTSDGPNTNTSSATPANGMGFSGGFQGNTFAGSNANTSSATPASGMDYAGSFQDDTLGERKPDIPINRRILQPKRRTGAQTTAGVGKGSSRHRPSVQSSSNSAQELPSRRPSVRFGVGEVTDINAPIQEDGSQEEEDDPIEKGLGMFNSIQKAERTKCQAEKAVLQAEIEALKNQREAERADWETMREKLEDENYSHLGFQLENEMLNANILDKDKEIQSWKGRIQEMQHTVKGAEDELQRVSAKLHQREGLADDELVLRLREEVRNAYLEMTRVQNEEKRLAGEYNKALNETSQLKQDLARDDEKIKVFEAKEEHWTRIENEVKAKDEQVEELNAEIEKLTKEMELLADDLKASKLTNRSSSSYYNGDFITDSLQNSESEANDTIQSPETPRPLGAPKNPKSPETPRSLRALRDPRSPQTPRTERVSKNPKSPQAQKTPKGLETAKSPDDARSDASLEQEMEGRDAYIAEGGDLGAEDYGYDSDTSFRSNFEENYEVPKMLRDMRKAYKERDPEAYALENAATGGKHPEDEDYKSDEDPSKKRSSLKALIDEKGEVNTSAMDDLLGSLDPEGDDYDSLFDDDSTSAQNGQNDQASSGSQGYAQQNKPTYTDSGVQSGAEVTSTATQTTKSVLSGSACETDAEAVKRYLFSTAHQNESDEIVREYLRTRPRCYFSANGESSKLRDHMKDPMGTPSAYATQEAKEQVAERHMRTFEEMINRQHHYLSQTYHAGKQWGRHKGIKDEKSEQRSRELNGHTPQTTEEFRKMMKESEEERLKAVKEQEEREIQRRKELREDEIREKQVPDIVYVLKEKMIYCPLRWWLRPYQDLILILSVFSWAAAIPSFKELFIEFGKLHEPSWNKLLVIIGTQTAFFAAEDDASKQTPSHSTSPQIPLDDPTITLDDGTIITPLPERLWPAKPAPKWKLNMLRSFSTAPPDTHAQMPNTKHVCLLLLFHILVYVLIFAWLAHWSMVAHKRNLWLAANQVTRELLISARSYYHADRLAEEAFWRPKVLSKMEFSLRKWMDLDMRILG
ncbi:MAG: hypothetical protein M1827_004734 [Pycnora praestabilis]|nr:MAG: hypothetical protein M1827_004734 [Pycnora praestabilis]